MISRKHSEIDYLEETLQRELNTTRDTEKRAEILWKYARQVSDPALQRLLSRWGDTLQTAALWSVNTAK